MELPVKKKSKPGGIKHQGAKCQVPSLPHYGVCMLKKIKVDVKVKGGE